MRVLVIAILLAAPLGAATYVDELCGYRFEVPKGWRVVQWHEPCAVRLRPQQNPEASQVVWISVGFHTTDLFYRDDDGKWVIEGRGSVQPAEAFELRGMQGLRGRSLKGVHREEGGLIGFADYLSVRLCTADDRCLSIQGGDDAVEPVVDSFTFTGPSRWNAEESYRRADALLNETYRQALARLSSAKRAKLREEQRDWIRRRDIECIPEAKECLERVTRLRIGELDPIQR